jgi:hypothetical protein
VISSQILLDVVLVIANLNKTTDFCLLLGSPFIKFGRKQGEVKSLQKLDAGALLRQTFIHVTSQWSY